MPAIVASGRKPDVRACGSCHRSEGTGGPENSSIAGLPVAYFVQQMADFKSGARKFSGPQRSAVTLMNAAAKAMTDAEVQAAAEYFAALKPKRNIKVVESDTVPKTYVARLFFVKRPEGGTETLGRRIVEMPDDVEQFELRDTRSQFTAYVPVGSLAKGEELVRTGNAGKTIACGICHGADLTGLGPIPSIAGRSPSYIVRQLYDIQHGERTGQWSPLMVNVVSKLSEEDFISIAAYLAAREP
jgi:cytochrome c553